ncbi:MAG TPA: RluA family pseudouridine synthase [Actinomycetota bacterium]|nr:RluA family pseudouridine synthase [Actinomycetota bacterium]
MKQLSFTASEDEGGSRLDVVVARRAAVTRALAQAAIKSEAVTVAGKPARPSYRLEPGDLVAGEVAVPTTELPAAEDVDLTLRYNDERVLVVSKPPGLVTHPARGHSSGTLVNALLGLGEPLAGATSIRPGIVHRLDKDTSGLLLVAKDDDAQAYLVAALKERRIERRYVALVRGRLASDSGTIEAPIGRHPVKRRQFAVVADGRPSITHYTVRALGEKVSFLDLKLETGRTHQIRVHLAHLGHPVLGDRVYGGLSELSRGLGLTRPFLHACSLRFPHPDDGREVAVEDELPEDLVAALGAAGLAEHG